MRCSRLSGCKAAEITIRASFPAASNSASPSRARLINDPEVLLADEPTGNLDSRTSVEVMGIFQELNEKGITIIMVTHEPDIASYARRNVVMRDGRIVKTIAWSRNASIAADEMAEARQRPNRKLANDRRT